MPEKQYMTQMHYFYDPTIDVSSFSPFLILRVRKEAPIRIATAELRVVGRTPRDEHLLRVCRDSKFRGDPSL
jgi:hypothetical protein